MMKKLSAPLVSTAFLASGLLALLLYAFPIPAPAQAPIVGPGQAVLCTSIANLTPATSISQVVPLSAGKTISICGWHVTNTATTGTFSISYGTGSVCATGNTVIASTQSVTSTAPDVDHQPTAFYSLPISAALCVTPSATSIAAVIYYNQF
jgi:hypothetical protein